jgi:hypothetical protein
MKAGDKVRFHFVSGRTEGKDENDKPTQGFEMGSQLATVVEDLGDDGLELEVDWSEDEIQYIVTPGHAMDGYATRQSSSRKATTEPPESGTWTSL